MPEGWNLFRAASAEADELVRDVFPSLAFPQSVRLLFRGGVRRGRRNDYFRFGPPTLRLEGARGKEKVCCNGVDLQPDKEGDYHLPSSLPAGIQLPVEVQRGGEVIKKQPLLLIDDFDWQWSMPRRLFDKFGRPVDTSQPSLSGVAGAALVGFPVAKAFFSPPASCFPNQRVFFAGPIPGQIVSWPDEDLPEDWIPVWAIPLGRRGRAMFCGTALQSAAAVERGNVSYSRKRVQLWKEVLYYRRGKIEPPTEATLQRLWKQYQEVARNVRT
jgi:hypothetical protein